MMSNNHKKSQIKIYKILQLLYNYAKFFEANKTQCLFF